MDQAGRTLLEPSPVGSVRRKWALLVTGIGSLLMALILVMFVYVMAAEKSLIENTIAGVWRIATTSTPAYLIFDSGSINLMTVAEGGSVEVAKVAPEADYRFEYKLCRLVNKKGPPHIVTISIPKTAQPPTTQLYDLDSIFVPGESITVSLNPSVGTFIATKASKTLQLIKDNEMSIEYLS